MIENKILKKYKNSEFYLRIIKKRKSCKERIDIEKMNLNMNL